MACDQQTLLLISSYADGEASPEEASNARAHLEQCGECRKLIEDWRSHRTMFEWTYNIKMPEQDLVQAEEWDMDNNARTERARFKLGGRWNWAAIGALAAVVTIAFVVYHPAELPPMLGSRLATALKSRTVRMASDIELKVGPNTSITRIGGNAIRLECGWLSASVHHGSGLRILTPRIEVTDQGTRFVVGSGPKLDYVVVEDGSALVTKGGFRTKVKSGQMLTAENRGNPSVVSLPQATDESIPRHQKEAFRPTGGVELEWQDGLRRIASRFPDVRPRIVRSIGFTGSSSGSECCVYMAADLRLRGELRRRCVDILQFAAGQPLDSGGWEIPVGVMMVTGIGAKPELPADMYFVRLVPAKGSLAWRLTGAAGGNADYPVTFEQVSQTVQPEDEDLVLGFGSTVKGIANGVLAESPILLAGWPGSLKPRLDLTALGRVTRSERDKQAMFEAVRKATGTKNDQWTDSQLLYLDTQRKNRFLVALYGDAGKRLGRFYGLMDRRRGGSETIGVMVTDQPLVEPPAPAGVYLLPLVLPESSRAVHWEISTPDSRQVVAWGSSALALAKNKTELFGSSHLINITSEKSLLFSPNTGPADHGSFPFSFRLSRNGPKVERLSADGVIRVRQP